MAATTHTQGSDGGPPSPADLSAARAQQRSGNPIPVLLAATVPVATTTTPARLVDAWAAQAGGPSPLDGIAVALSALPAVVAAAAGKATLDSVDTGAAVTLVLDALRRGGPAGSKPSADDDAAAAHDGSTAAVSSPPAAPTTTPAAPAPAPAPPRRPGQLPGQPGSGGVGGEQAGWARRLLGPGSVALLGEEQEALGRVGAFLQQVVPDLPEVGGVYQPWLPTFEVF